MRVVELFEGAWFEAVYQLDPGKVRLVGDVGGEHSGVYELDVETLEVRRLMPRGDIG